jgi:hypothetical protein
VEHPADPHFASPIGSRACGDAAMHVSDAMISLVGELVAAMIGFGGALAGARVTARSQSEENNRVDLRSRTLRLYEQWQSVELLKARIIANAALRDNVKPGENDESDMLLPWDQLREKLGPMSPGWQAVLEVVHFFAALEALQAQKAVETTTFDALFTGYIDFWRQYRFEPLLRLTPDAAAEWKKGEWQDVVSALRNLLWSRPNDPKSDVHETDGAG